MLRKLGFWSSMLALGTFLGCADESPLSSSAPEPMADAAAKLTISAGEVAGLAEITRGPAGPRDFTVTIENVSTPPPYSSSGAFNTPTGAAGPGPAHPGDTYEFTVTAAPGSWLSFATMYVQSNDLFFSPGSAGLALYDAAGTPISGDITGQIGLWDAGTEINQEPGVGTDQAPRQTGPNTGADENGPVQIVNDGFT
jgi:hypothetical protein